MGKSYFEFLEEEFQALTSQLQVSLSAPQTASSSAGISTQFTRCQAVLQQLKQEARKDQEFKDRLGLYEIQLKAFQDFNNNENCSTTATSRSQDTPSSSSSSSDNRQEITFKTWIEQPRGRHLMLERARNNQN